MSSSLNVHYGEVSCFMSAVLESQPSNRYVLRPCDCVSFGVASFVLCTVMHVWVSVASLMELMLNGRLTNSSSLFFAWFCLHS